MGTCARRENVVAPTLKCFADDVVVICIAEINCWSERIEKQVLWLALSRSRAPSYPSMTNPPAA